MGLLDFLFKKKPTEYRQIYCQGCNVDITKIGGYVSSEGKAYCGKVKPDGGRCITGRMPTPANAERFQEAIRDGDLTKYGSLEERTKLLHQLSPAVRKFSTKDM